MMSWPMTSASAIKRRQVDVKGVFTQLAIRPENFTIGGAKSMLKRVGLVLMRFDIGICRRWTFAERLQFPA